MLQKLGLLKGWPILLDILGPPSLRRQFEEAPVLLASALNCSPRYWKPVCVVEVLVDALNIQCRFEKCSGLLIRSSLAIKK